MSDCIFCKIINGDFNTEFVLENDYAVVFRDINPKADTHLLVVPRKKKNVRKPKMKKNVIQ